MTTRDGLATHHAVTVNVIFAGQLATKMPFANGMLTVPKERGQVGAVTPGVKGILGLSPGMSDAPLAENSIFGGSFAASAFAGAAA
jgi:hypothetical protein